jgi:hypothetical protein
MGTAEAPRLRAVRHEHAAFAARFFDAREEFWPIARAARTFADHAAWPRVEEYAGAFVDPAAAPVDFVAALPRRRRPPGPIDRSQLYDAIIVQRRQVPTRPSMWHDYLNALVWATFPRAKLELHRRQHAAIERWVPPGATQLPNARTRELDALALIDEGGVLALDDGARPVRELVDDPSGWIFFGHALFEGLVFGRPAMISRAVVLDARGRERPAPFRSEATALLADELLAAALADGSAVATPDALSRLPLSKESYFRP